MKRIIAYLALVGLVDIGLLAATRIGFMLEWWSSLGFVVICTLIGGVGGVVYCLRGSLSECLCSEVVGRSVATVVLHKTSRQSYVRYRQLLVPESRASLAGGTAKESGNRTRLHGSGVYCGAES